jgi:hypothetical protein
VAELDSTHTIDLRPTCFLLVQQVPVLLSLLSRRRAPLNRLVFHGNTPFSRLENHRTLLHCYQHAQSGNHFDFFATTGDDEGLLQRCDSC